MPSLRERKKVACRAALQRAALELAHERGNIHAVTVDDVAERAGVATRTFFNYFPTKESALINAYIGRSDDMARQILDWPDDDPPGRIIARVLIDTALNLDAEGMSLLRSVLAENPDLLGLSTGNALATNRTLADAAAQRLGTDDLHVRRRLGQLTAALSAVIRMTIGFHSKHDLPPEDLDAALDEAVEGVLAGLGIPEETRAD